MKTLGIVTHSAEGSALCFLTACHAGAAQLGARLHPPIVLSAVPRGLSMPGGEALHKRPISLRAGWLEVLPIACKQRKEPLCILD
mgnify:CR=1 FL=1